MMSSQSDAVPGEPVQLGSEAEFDRIVDAYDVVLVDFYADWCGPCQMMEPTIESLAAETDAAVLKVDVDQFQALAGQYQVQGIPTLLVFAHGELAERMVGAQTGESLSQTLAGYTE
jgi:thioredoxin 1